MLYIFPIEVKYRDLDSRLRIALELAKKGHQSVIGNRSTTESIATLKNLASVYFSLILNSDSVEFYKKIKSTGSVMVSLDEENSINLLNNSMDWFLYHRYEKESLLYTSLIFFWGERTQQKILEKQSWFNPDQTEVVGNVRFDLRHPKYNDFYRSLFKHNNHVKNGYVLINTAFGPINNVLKGDLWMQKGIRLAKTDNIVDKLTNKKCYQTLVFSHLISALKRLLEEYPQVDFVLRPHPIEQQLTYEKLFGHFSNFHIIREGVAHQWIVDSIAVIHHDCTTGLEAFFNMKNVFSFAPLFDPTIARDFNLLSGEVIKTEDELVTRLGDVIREQEASQQQTPKKDFHHDSYEKEKKQLLKPMIANVDEPALAKIVKTIYKHQQKWFDPLKDKILQLSDLNKLNAIDEPRKTNPWLLCKQTAGTLFRRIKNTLINGIYPDRKSTLTYRSLKMTAISREEIQGYIEGFRLIDPEIPRMQVEEISVNSYLLTPKDDKNT